MRDHLIGKLDLDEKIFQEQFFFQLFSCSENWFRCPPNTVWRCSGDLVLNWPRGWPSETGDVCRLGDSFKRLLRHLCFSPFSLTSFFNMIGTLGAGLCTIKVESFIVSRPQRKWCVRFLGSFSTALVVSCKSTTRQRKIFYFLNREKSLKHINQKEKSMTL